MNYHEALNNRWGPVDIVQESARTLDVGNTVNIVDTAISLLQPVDLQKQKGGLIPQLGEEVVYDRDLRKIQYLSPQTEDAVLMSKRAIVQPGICEFIKDTRTVNQYAVSRFETKGEYQNGQILRGNNDGSYIAARSPETDTAALATQSLRNTSSLMETSLTPIASRSKDTTYRPASESMRPGMDFRSADAVAFRQIEAASSERYAQQPFEPTDDAFDRAQSMLLHSSEPFYGQRVVGQQTAIRAAEPMEPSMYRVQDASSISTLVRGERYVSSDQNVMRLNTNKLPMRELTFSQSVVTEFSSLASSMLRNYMSEQ